MEQNSQGQGPLILLGDLGDLDLNLCLSSQSLELRHSKGNKNKHLWSTCCVPSPVHWALQKGLVEYVGGVSLPFYR